ncbi:MAG: M48 family metallopeptidase, partial [Bacilli bacterium]
ISLQLRKKKEKKETPNSYLGEVIDVVYCNVIKKPVLENEKLLVKDDKMLLKWYLVVAKEVFESRIQAIYDLFEEKIPYPKLKIRSMKTRWGVCNRRDNSVTLNLELIKKNQVFLDYVIVHELSHFVCFNHSPDFWKEVEKYCPNYKNIRKKLKE